MSPKTDPKKKQAVKKAKAPKTIKAIDLGPPRPVPQLPRPKAPVLPGLTERTLSNGLRVIAVRRSGLPLVQLRLVLTTSRPKVTPAETARQQVLGAAFTSGTSTRTAAQIAVDLDGLGGTMAAGADEEAVSIFGSVLAPNLKAWLAVLSDVITDATFPASEVGTERDRVAQGIVASLADPSTVATNEMFARYFGEHPYGVRHADPELVRQVTSAQLKAYVRSRVGPGGGTLVIVGDVPAAAAINAVEAALGTWASGTSSAPLAAHLPPAPGAAYMIDRPGAVQTNIRVVGAAVDRNDPTLPALTLATTILGGGMTSRLFLNLREDKGYTYTPGAGIMHLRAHSAWYAVADVGVDVTGPALAELRYELGRISSLPVAEDELENTKRYLIGTQALSIQSMAGLAGRITGLAVAGLGPDWLKTWVKALDAASLDDVLAAAQRHLGPGHVTTVLVGDKEKILAGVAAQMPVTLVEG